MPQNNPLFFMPTLKFILLSQTDSSLLLVHLHCSYIHLAVQLFTQALGNNKTDLVCNPTFAFWFQNPIFFTSPPPATPVPQLP